jgi:hypothetical protein
MMSPTMKTGNGYGDCEPEPPPGSDCALVLQQRELVETAKRESRSDELRSALLRRIAR